jgi:hypothetical protein
MVCADGGPCWLDSVEQGMDMICARFCVRPAGKRQPHTQLRQTGSRNLWFGCNWPELCALQARLWIRRVLVRAQEGQLNVWRCLGLVSGAAVVFVVVHA